MAQVSEHAIATDRVACSSPRRDECQFENNKDAMMIFSRLNLTIGTAMMALGVPALAEEPAADAGASAAIATPAADVAAPAYSAEEIDNYAKAYVATAAISGNASLSDAAKQEAMAKAVADQGLDNEKFNEMSAAWQKDEALLEQFNAAIEKAKTEAAGATAAVAQ